MDYDDIQDLTPEELDDLALDLALEEDQYVETYFEGPMWH